MLGRGPITTTDTFIIGIPIAIVITTCRKFDDITITNQSQQNIQGALYVIDYLLKTVSKNRAQDMWNDIFVITRRLYSKAPKTPTIIEKLTGIIFDLKNLRQVLQIGKSVVLSWRKDSVSGRPRSIRLHYKQD